MIRQFDVYRNPLRGSRDVRPYVLAIQHLFWDPLPTRVVMPLVTRATLDFQPRLNPAFEIGGQTVYLSPTEPIAMSTRFLREPVANLAQARDRIIGALDLVFTGV